MAVVSRITTLELTGSLGTRKWVATAATQDTAAGSSVVVTVTITTTGSVPPPQANTFELSFRIDNGSTIVRTVSLTPGTSSQQVTFHFTNTGLSGGSSRAGTIRMRIFAENTTGAPTDRYTVNSDDTVGQTLGTGQSVTQRDQGWIRGTTTSTQTLSNISLGGGKNSPFQYQDILYLRTTLGATLYSSRALTVSIGGARSGATNSGTSGNFDRTFSGTSTTVGRVNKGFSASNNNYATGITIPNASLTGSPDFTVSNTSDNANIDPRVTMVHLLQINDNTISTPPLSSPNIASERVFPDIGYLSTAIYPARGSRVTTVVSGGLNGIVFDVNFADPLGTNIGGTGFTTSTQGGEAGWQDALLAWTNAIAGIHTKTVSITTSDLNDSNYWISNQITYNLVASNPAITAMVAGGNLSELERHAIPDDTVTVGLVLVHTEDKELVATDTGTAQIVVRKVLSPGKSQHLLANGTWTDDIDGAGNPVQAYAFTAGEAVTDSRLYVVNLPSNALVDGSDLFIVGRGVFQGSPYSSTVSVAVTGAKNQHHKNDFDATGLFK